MIFVIFQIVESDYGYIFDVDGKRVFVFKPYYGARTFISTDTSLKFAYELIESLKNRLKEFKPYTVLVYPRTKFKIDGVKYNADVVEGIPEGTHTVDIPGYVKARINFKDYDIFVFITKEYKKKPAKVKKVEEKVEKEQIQEMQRVDVRRTREAEFYISEGIGLVCGATGGCAGCMLGGTISDFNPIITLAFGALGCLGGYTTCKGFVKRSCF